MMTIPTIPRTTRTTRSLCPRLLLLPRPRRARRPTPRPPLLLRHRPLARRLPSRRRRPRRRRPRPPARKKPRSPSRRRRLDRKEMPINNDWLYEREPTFPSTFCDLIPFRLPYTDTDFQDQNHTDALSSSRPRHPHDPNSFTFRSFVDHDLCLPLPPSVDLISDDFRLSARSIGKLSILLWVDAESILWDDVSCIMCRLISTVSRLGLLTCDFASYRFPTALLY
jgi:hypothetical protein